MGTTTSEILGEMVANEALPEPKLHKLASQS